MRNGLLEILGKVPKDSFRSPKLDETDLAQMGTSNWVGINLGIMLPNWLSCAWSVAR